jgi:hypothetical protein
MLIPIFDKDSCPLCDGPLEMIVPEEGRKEGSKVGCHKCHALFIRRGKGGREYQWVKGDFSPFRTANQLVQ